MLHCMKDSEWYEKKNWYPNHLVWLQAGTGDPSQPVKLGRLCWKSLKARFWCVTAVTLSTCWPCLWRPAVGRPAYASSTARAPSGWTPFPLACLNCSPSRMFSASYSTTWAWATRRRVRRPMTSSPKPSPTLPSSRRKTAACLWSWCSPCTNQRPSPLCSTWRASPSTDTPDAPSSCHSQSLCCATCRTTLFTYEGLCGSGAGHRGRVTLHEHTLRIWDSVTPQATDEPSRRILKSSNVRHYWRMSSVSLQSYCCSLE